MARSGDRSLRIIPREKRRAEWQGGSTWRAEDGNAVGRQRWLFGGQVRHFSALAWNQRGKSPGNPVRFGRRQRHDGQQVLGKHAPRIALAAVRCSCRAFPGILISVQNSTERSARGHPNAQSMTTATLNRSRQGVYYSAAHLVGLPIRADSGWSHIGIRVTTDL